MLRFEPTAQLLLGWLSRRLRGRSPGGLSVQLVEVQAASKVAKTAVLMTAQKADWKAKWRVGHSADVLAAMKGPQTAERWAAPTLDGCQVG
jgi:hypothetical protein